LSLRVALVQSCPEKGLKPPSHITLKNWSAQGLFESCATLGSATKAALKKMATNPAAYALAQQHEAIAAQSDRSENTRPAPRSSTRLSETAPAVESRLSAIEQQIASLARVLGQGSPAASGLRAGGQPGTAGTGQDQDRLIQAVAQLDSVRKHMMVRLDNEMVLIRRHNDGQSDAPSKQHSATNELDLHRILSKLNQLSSIESRVSNMEDNIEKLLKLVTSRN